MNMILTLLSLSTIGFALMGATGLLSTMIGERSLLRAVRHRLDQPRVQAAPTLETWNGSTVTPVAQRPAANEGARRAA